jgi:hypothetical protein
MCVIDEKGERDREVRWKRGREGEREEGITEMRYYEFIFQVLLPG